MGFDNLPRDVRISTDMKPRPLSIGIGLDDFPSNVRISANTTPIPWLLRIGGDNLPCDVRIHTYPIPFPRRRRMGLDDVPVHDLAQSDMATVFPQEEVDNIILADVVARLLHFCSSRVFVWYV